MPVEDSRRHGRPCDILPGAWWIIGGYLCLVGFWWDFTGYSTCNSTVQRENDTACPHVGLVLYCGGALGFQRASVNRDGDAAATAHVLRAPETPEDGDPFAVVRHPICHRTVTSYPYSACLSAMFTKGTRNAR